LLHMSLGRVTYVIGGGPSLKGFDFSKLDGYKIGANKSAIVAKCDCMVSVDKTYAERSFKDIKEFEGEVILGYGRPTHVKNRIPNVTYVKWNRARGLSNDPEVINGLNSGYAALNVAYQKGAKNIALLGFDMKMGDTKHFHEGYSWDSGSGNYKAWAKLFDDAKTVLDRSGVEVINYVGPQGSALYQFPTRPLEEIQ